MSENNEKPDPEMIMSKKQFRMTMLMILGLGLLWAIINQLTDTSRRQPASAVAPAAPAKELYREYRTYPIMGTMAEVSLYGDRDTAVKAADAVYDTFKEVEKLANIHDPQSELSQLNQTAAREAVVCSPLLWKLLQESRRAWKISDGAFDITARPLMVMWGFYVKAKKGLPDESVRLKTLQLVGLEKVTFDDAKHTVKFQKEGMSFDLGGIAKGIAVDLAVEKVKALGIKCGIVNLAGNMYCFPEPPPGKTAYSIGIRNPVNKDASCGVVSCLNISIATSGNYERYVIINGKQYTHIMNVKTGMPVENMLSTSIITPTATDADLLSTSVFINGEEFARKICKAMPGTEIMLIKPGKNGPETIKIGDKWGDIKL